MQPQSQGERRLAVFAITSSGAVLATLDQFVVNVALPSIGRSLHSDISSLSWVLNSYSIVFAALLVPAGRLADRNGRKTVFMLGVGLFTVASLACAGSSNLAELNTARAVQAVGAAMLLPSSLGLLLAAYPAQRRAAAVRAWTVVTAASAALGPVAGGLLVTVSWRWIFLINLPVGVAAIAFAARLLPATPAERGPLPDFAGAAALAIGTGSLSLGLVKAQTWGWSSAKTIGVWVLALLLGVLFAWRSQGEVEQAGKPRIEVGTAQRVHPADPVVALPDDPGLAQHPEVPWPDLEGARDDPRSESGRRDDHRSLTRASHGPSGALPPRVDWVTIGIWPPPGGIQAGDCPARGACSEE